MLSLLRFKKLNFSSFAVIALFVSALFVSCASTQGSEDMTKVTDHSTSTYELSEVTAPESAGETEAEAIKLWNERK